MRIDTNGSNEYRSELFSRTAERLHENTKTAAIERSCLHTTADIDAKAEVIHYLAGELPPRKLERVADMLSTKVVTVEIDVSESVNVE